MFKTTGFNAKNLMEMKLPEPKWAIPGLLPECVTILGGKPKKGKSTLALNISLAIATNDVALGNIQVEGGSVIYLALEDSLKRLQWRLRTMLPQSSSAPEKLYLYTEWPRMGENGIERLSAEIKIHKDTRLVIIDTFAKFRPPRGSRNIYEIDYEHISQIKELADKHVVSILIIHHLRKLDADDPFDTFSGSHGLTGAADTLFVLDTSTTQADAVLYVTGRDVEQADYALSFERSTMTWHWIGYANEIQSSSQRQKIYDTMKSSSASMTLKDICNATGVNYKAVQKAVSALQKESFIKRIRHGEYIYNGDNRDISCN